MKRLNLLLLCTGLGIVACGSNNSEPEVESSSISCVPTQINATHEKTTVPLEVTSSGEWAIYSKEKWITCNISGSIRTKETVQISLSANTDNSTREGSVIVRTGKTQVTVPVSQEAKPVKPVDPTIQAPEGYQLVWNDEFDEGNSPSEEWFYETGGNGWGNNELQHYVAGDKDGEQLAVVKNGVLTITAKKIGGTVYSIRVNTRKSWKYGYFEARLKLPKGKGTWPAFWMMPQNFGSWPADGEIDIMEEVGYDPNTIVSTIHCNAYNHNKGTQKSGTMYIPTAQTEFHVYAVEWTENYITGYADGKPYFTFTNDGKGNKDTWPFNTPFYLKLNLAWGGNWGGAQGVDESVLPATYEIDYVRVFQKK